MEQLPVELKAEILSRLPPQSLVQFRSVSKQWNSLLKDKSFVDLHFSRSRPQFILRTHYNVYLIDIINIDPKTIGSRIELPHLHSYVVPLMWTYLPTFNTCEEFLYGSGIENMIEFWNPWLRQVKRFKYEYKDKWFCLLGIGYDNTKPEKAYKVLGKLCGLSDQDGKAAIFDCASQVFKFIDSPDYFHLRSDELSIVSLNGNLYWVSYNHETQKWFIQSFDFSMETFKPFCLHPCQKIHLWGRVVLAAYKADRLSLLKLTYRTKKIEILVTKNKICKEEKDVVWIKLMTLPLTNLPRRFTSFDHISYLIYDKTLFMCCKDDKTRSACIYIVREDLCMRIQIDHGIGYCYHHSFYTPNLISVPYFRG